MGRRFGEWLIIILIASFGLRIVPLLNNNFYFTADQGRDAVYVRDILANKRIFKTGPETTVKGIFTGPLWFYFLAVGYGITAGHPAGGVLLMIGLQIATLAVLAKFLRRRIGDRETLYMIAGLSVFWGFYQTARYAFNPFPLVFLGVILMLSLIELSDGKTRFAWWSLLITGLAYNANIPGTIVFFGLWLSAVIYGFGKGWFDKRVPAAIFIFFLIAGLGFRFKIDDAISGAGQLRTTNLVGVGEEIIKVFGRVVLPQAEWLGAIAGLIILIYFGRRNRIKWQKNWLILISICIGLSWAVIGIGGIYRDWYLIYLPTLIFITFGLILLTSGKAGKTVFGVITVMQLIFFIKEYTLTIRFSDDKSILKNQLAAIDAAYQMNSGEGFAVYTYTKSYYDYPQQYLLWWYGLRKYGYLPCDYANLPYTGKVYIPDSESFVEPKKWCEKNRVLIVEDATNGEKNYDWIDDFKQTTVLAESKNVGQVVIEKRTLKPNHNEFYFRELIMREYRNNEMAISVPIYWEYKNLGNKMVFNSPDGLTDLLLARIGKACNITSDGSRQRLVEGKRSNYFARIKMTGVMMKSNGLAEEILKSIKIYDENGALIEQKCDILE